MRSFFTVSMLVLSFFTYVSQAHADYATTPDPGPGAHWPYPSYGTYPGTPGPLQPVPAPLPGYPGPGYPQPGTPVYPPAPAYPQPPMFPVPAPYVMCFAQGLANGAVFYGVGLNYYAANQWALYACGSTGQYCQLLGCR